MARLESSRAQDAFARFGITEALGRDHFFQSVYEAVETLGDQSETTSPG
jgi:hypothetical protein